jgi:hypothetical protein
MSYHFSWFVVGGSKLAAACAHDLVWEVRYIYSHAQNVCIRTDYLYAIFECFILVVSCVVRLACVQTWVLLCCCIETKNSLFRYYVMYIDLFNRINFYRRLSARSVEGCVWMAGSAETNNASGRSSSRRQRSAAAAAAVWGGGQTPPRRHGQVKEL